MEYVDTYKQLKISKPLTARGRARKIALDILTVRNSILGIESQLNVPRIQFLYVHHIFKDEEKKLEKLIERLSINHSFLSYADAVDKIIKREIEKPYIVISTDDGFRNNLRAGEILSKHGIKACFFINPNIIGENNFEKVRVHCQTRLNFPPVEFLDWDEVEQIQNLGHEIGSHTMSHVNIGNATPEEIHSEIGNSYTIIKSKCGEAKHFAFPYGRFFHFSETGRKAVFEAGFISCATAERGCHISNDRPIVAEQLCILRDHVVLDWNIDHIFHFLANNSSHANSKNNFYPPLKL